MRSDASHHPVKRNDFADAMHGHFRMTSVSRPIDGTVAPLPPPNFDSIRYHFKTIFGPQEKTNQEIDMTVHSASRPSLGRVDTMPNRHQQEPANTLRDIQPETGKSPPAGLGSKDRGRRHLLNKNISTGNLQGRLAGLGHDKVAIKEDRDKNSGNQSNQGHTSERTPDSTASRTAELRKKPNSQSEPDGNRGHPFLDLFGKFGEVILHAFEIMNNLLKQLTGMLDGTASRAAKSAKTFNDM